MFVLCVLYTSVYAATTTTTFNVLAFVDGTCTVSAADLNFGNYTSAQGTNLDQSTTVTVNCTNLLPYSVALSTGSGTYTNRTMTDSGSANPLNYNLYTDGTYTTVWGDSSGSTGVVTGTGTGSSQALTVFGRVPSSQTPGGTGVYTDKTPITVTVTY